MKKVPESVIDRTKEDLHRNILNYNSDNYSIQKDKEELKEREIALKKFEQHILEFAQWLDSISFDNFVKNTIDEMDLSSVDVSKFRINSHKEDKNNDG